MVNDRPASPYAYVKRPKVGMNEGSGFGRNVPTESIYYEAIKEHYEMNSVQKRDVDVCAQYMEFFKINLEDIEEVYNFARFIEYQYIRYINSRIRLQLNTRLLR